MANINAQFLNAIDTEAKDLILKSIADHYEVSPDVIFEEVTGDEAEHLLEYMVEPQRSATRVLMQRRGFNFPA